MTIIIWRTTFIILLTCLVGVGASDVVRNMLADLPVFARSTIGVVVAYAVALWTILEARP
jgi:uncharacterized membrane protein